MSIHFTPSVLNEMQDQIGHSLNNIFSIMFHYALSPQTKAVPLANGLTAYVPIRHGETKLYLDVHLSDIIIEDLTRKSVDTYGTVDFSIGQDVACEVANIIGHTIRTYLMNTQGTTFSVGTPIIGPSPSENMGLDILTIQSTNESHGTVTLHLLYPKAA